MSNAVWYAWEADVIWHGAGARDVGGGTHGPIITVCRVGIAERSACSSVARGAICGRRLRDVEGGGDGLGHPCIDVAAVGGDGGPLAHVEGDAVDLAEVAVEAGEM